VNQKDTYLKIHLKVYKKYIENKQMQTALFLRGKNKTDHICEIKLENNHYSFKEIRKKI
jgi:Tfp pilus assembly major pilin PilA